MIQSTESFDWFKFNNTMSDDFDFVVENMNVAVLPERKVQRFSVLGRDGDLTKSEDTYSPYLITIKGHVPIDAPFDLIYQWLSGQSDLIFSYNADKRYRAEISGEVRPVFLAIYWQLEINMLVQPFAREAEPEVIEKTASGTLFNPGNRWSLPVITVYGAGTLTIGGYTLVIAATAGESFVVINSEAGTAYYESGGVKINRGNKVTGNFPVLDPGEIAVTVGTGITNVKIQGNWRWF